MDGTWKVAVKTPMGDEESVLEVTEDGGVLSGTQTAHGETSPIFDGQIDGNAVQWKVELTKPWSFELSFRGELEGDALSGRVKPGFFPETGFVGTR